MTAITSPAIMAVFMTVTVLCFLIDIYCLYLVRRLNRDCKRAMSGLSSYAAAVRTGGTAIPVEVGDLLIIAQAENFVYGK